MEKFAVDLDKVLDEFEFNEGIEQNHLLSSTTTRTIFWIWLNYFPQQKHRIFRNWSRFFYCCHFWQFLTFLSLAKFFFEQSRTWYFQYFRHKPKCFFFFFRKNRITKFVNFFVKILNPFCNRNSPAIFFHQNGGRKFYTFACWLLTNK